MLVSVFAALEAAAQDRDGWAAVEYEQCTGHCGGWELPACGADAEPARCPVAQGAMAEALFANSVSAVSGTVVRLQGDLFNGATWVLMIDLPGPVVTGTSYAIDGQSAAEWLYYESYDGDLVFQGDTIVGQVYVDDAEFDYVVLSFDFCITSEGPDGRVGTEDDTSRVLGCGSAGTWNAYQTPLVVADSGEFYVDGGGTSALEVFAQVVILSGQDPYEPYVEDDGGCRPSDDDSGCNSQDDDTAHSGCSDSGGGGCGDADGDYNNSGDSGCDGELTDGGCEGDSSGDGGSSGGCCSADASEMRGPWNRHKKQTFGRLAIWFTAFGSFFWLTRRRTRY